MKSLKTIFQNEKILRQFLWIAWSLFILRILAHIPVPWVDISLLRNAGESGILAFANMFSGTVFSSYTFGSIGISAYISASILIQTAGFFIKPLHRLRSDPGGEKIIKRLTLRIGIIIAFISSILTTYTLDSYYEVLLDDSWYVFLIIAVIHASATGFCVYVGETITETGFSEGISLIITTNILASVPRMIQSVADFYQTGEYTNQTLLILAGVILFMFIATAGMEKSERQIPVVYMKEKKSSFSTPQKTLNIRLNIAGIMPIIYFAYLYQAITWIATITGNTTVSLIMQSFSYGSVPYAVMSCIFILVFSVFYTYVLVDTRDIAYFLQVRGGVIPGIRQGRDTAVYLRKEVNQVSFVGAVYLAMITTIPFFILLHFDLNIIETSAIMILMGTALSTVRTLHVELDIVKGNDFFLS